jgi:hypothetical protein
MSKKEVTTEDTESTEKEPQENKRWSDDSWRASDAIRGTADGNADGRGCPRMNTDTERRDPPEKRGPT